MSLEERVPDESETPSSSERPVANLPAEEDEGFLAALTGAGLMRELDDAELRRIAEVVDPGAAADVRWVDLLLAYYGPSESGDRRRGQDHFFVQALGEPATAAGLVARLSALWPALGGMALERIGGEHGPLVVRAGEHVCAVLDDYDDESDTDQVDLSELERSTEVPTVSVRGLVRSTNVLLDRHGVRERMISLRGDEEREVYVSFSITHAMTLVQTGYLEDEDPEELMTLAAW